MNRSDELLAEASLRARVGPFSDPGLEQAYQRDYLRLTIRTVRAALALAIGLFVLFALLDPYLAPGKQVRLQVVRLGVVSPILLALLAWSYSTSFARRLVDAQVFAVLVGGSAIIYLGTLGDHVVADAQYIGLLLAVMWTHAVSRLPFRIATAAALVLSVEYVLVELWLDRLSATALVYNAFLLASANLIGMISSYHLELGFRRDFQQRRLLDQRRRELEASVDQLHEAELRVSELESRAPDSIENLPRWADQIAGV
jgi:hypothetical protein